MAKINSRYLAIETLQRLADSKTPLPIIFQQVCKIHKPDSSDRALTMNLIYGVLRQRQYLDLLLKNLCRQPIKKLHPYVRQALAVGLYQIFFLDRIPHSAAVNETVNAAKTAKIPKRLHGFINGVLRESIRQRETLPQPEEIYSNQPPILNHPDWMISRWQKHFGAEETVNICRYNNSQQPLVLRVNRGKIERDQFINLLSKADVEALPGRYSPDAVTVPGFHGQVSALPGYTEDFFKVQGEAAQLASLLLAPIVPEGRYLDGCAGLGGKTGHLIQLLTPAKAELVAIEPEKHRQEKLLENLEGTPEEMAFSLYRGTLQEYCRSKPPLFDGIIIDAPCSGTGITGKQPDIRWQRSVSDIVRYAEIQYELLSLAATLLQPQGVLVYATCSLEPEENIEVVKRFLDSNSHFFLQDPAPHLPMAAAVLTRQRCFQPLPCDQIDGFFAARLVHSNCHD